MVYTYNLFCSAQTGSFNKVPSDIWIIVNNNTLRIFRLAEETSCCYKQTTS